MCCAECEKGRSTDTADECQMSIILDNRSANDRWAELADTNGRWLPTHEQVKGMETLLEQSQRV